MRTRRTRRINPGLVIASTFALLGGTVAAHSESTGFYRGTLDDGAVPGPLDGAAGKSSTQRRLPPEPDRSYRAAPRARVQDRRGLPSSSDEQSLELLLERFRTESVTLDGKSESFELSPDAKRRIMDDMRKSRRGTGLPALEEKPRNSAESGDSESVRRRPPPNEAIFGRDTRDRITNTTTFPYRAVGYLAGGCSGALIGPRHVLTAGHCIYDVDKRTWIRSVNEFWPAQDGPTSPFGSVAVVRLISVTGWTEGGDRESDFGLALLGEDLGSRLGWLGYGWEEPMKRYNINLLGYPSDKPNWTMWHSFCPLGQVTARQLRYKCAQWPGNSGGPVYVFRAEDDSRTIYGIAAYGYLKQFSADADISLGNEATRIDQIRFETIKGWLARY